MKNLLSEGAKALGISLNDVQLDNFIKYMELLLEWNENVNLTAITEPGEVITKHFLDSLTALNLIPDGASVADIGCGAGFPGLPLKMARDDIKLTLLDSLAKRINFLNAVITETGISGVTCVHSRAEDAGQDKEYREKFDVAVSRAVANLTTLSEYCLPFVKVGGYFIALKGPLADEELAAAKKAIRILGGELMPTVEASVPFTDLNHKIVIIKKVAKCPLVYPRKAGTPSKKPLL